MLISAFVVLFYIVVSRFIGIATGSSDFGDILFGVGAAIGMVGVLRAILGV